MEYRVTDTFLEFYQRIPDEHIGDVDAVLSSILANPGSASSRAGRIERTGDDRPGGAWIVRLHIGEEPHNLYWVEEDEETVLFIGLARTN